MPVVHPPDQPIVTFSSAASATCREIDDFLTSRGWWSVRSDHNGTQWWQRSDTHGYFSTAEAIGYEFIRFINIGHNT